MLDFVKMMSEETIVTSSKPGEKDMRTLGELISTALGGAPVSISLRLSLATNSVVIEMTWTESKMSGDEANKAVSKVLKATFEERNPNLLVKSSEGGSGLAQMVFVPGG